MISRQEIVFLTCFLILVAIPMFGILLTVRRDMRRVEHATNGMKTELEALARREGRAEGWAAAEAAAEAAHAELSKVLAGRVPSTGLST